VARRLRGAGGRGQRLRQPLGSYIDPQLATAGLAQEFVYPNRDAWQANQRTVVCEVSATEGRLTGSVRANG